MGNVLPNSVLHSLPMHSAHVLSWAAPVHAQGMLSDTMSASYTCAYVGCAFMASHTNQAPLGITLKLKQSLN